MTRRCPQCGATVDLSPEQIAALCAFCASPLVDAEGVAERIDRVAPFDVGKQVAGGLLAEHLQDRWFIPESLRNAGRPKQIHGVLIPFWCYDATARSVWTARQGIHWYRTETYTVQVDGKTVTRTRQVKETEWFTTSGSHVANYVDHLVSGSRGLPEDEANELEPFDLGRALPYSPDTLAGWVAERPTIGREEAESTAAQELADAENGAIRAFLPADTVSDVENQTSMEVGGLELAMLPVWIATYGHGEDVLRLLVNGQTGEVVAMDLPKSWPKILGLVGAILGLLGFVALVVVIVAVVAGG